MTAKCPKGHESEWEDYCSICGDPLGGVGPGPKTIGASGSDPGAAPAAATLGASSAASPGVSSAAPAGPACSNCNEPHGPDDVFCENCGFDFGSQTLPDPSPNPGAAPGVVPTSGAVAVPTVAVVTVDRAYYDAMIGDNDLAFPDPMPAEVEVPLVGAKALIGRSSQSRGIFPEIDIAEITADPAASSRHAMLEHDDDGNWTIDDLGSTNGTLVGAVEGDAIMPGVQVPLPPGTAVYLGAWTRIEIVAK